MNIADLILILLLLCAVILAVRSIIKTKKNGCGCGCSGCSSCTACSLKGRTGQKPAA